MLPPPKRTSPSEVYAGFWRRVGAAAIDLAVLWVLTISATGLLLASRKFKAESELIVAFQLVALLLYYAGFESSGLQATLGKLAMDLKVTDSGGERISFNQAIGRCLARYLTYATLGIGFLMASVTRYRQSLHDMISGTLVVRRAFDAAQIAGAGPIEKAPLAGRIAMRVVLYPLGLLFLVSLAFYGFKSYQDRSIASQVAEGLEIAAVYQAEIESAWSQGMALEKMDSESLHLKARGGKFVAYVEVIRGAIFVTYARDSDQVIYNKVLRIVPVVDDGKKLAWFCGLREAPTLDYPRDHEGYITTVRWDYLPQSCK